MSNGEGDERGWFDTWRETWSEAYQSDINPRFESTGAYDWPEKNPDKLYGGITWQDYEIFSDIESASIFYEDVLSRQNDVYDNGRVELGAIKLVERDDGDYEVVYTVFVVGGTGES